MLDTISPHTMEAATGPQISELPPRPVASENRPAMVVNDVIMIGIILLLAAATIAWIVGKPAARLAFAVEIMTMAAFTAIPASATTPYIVNRLSG